MVTGTHFTDSIMDVGYNTHKFLSMLSYRVKLVFYDVAMSGDLRVIT